MFGPFLPATPVPFLSPTPSHFQANYSALISNFVEESINNNKKDKAFLLLEIRIAIQGDS
jgi:hypothetical protein